MAFTTINKSSDYFDTSIWTGNSTSRLIPLDFEPSFVWGKARSVATQHALFDAVRGATGRLKSDTNGAEVPNSGVTAFNSNGFTNGTSDSLNQNGQTFVSWSWKANGQGSSNTDGTINSTYTSANTTSGFSIVQYTGNGTAGATVGHGLGAAVKTIIIKKYNTSSDWVYGSSGMGFTKYMNLNSTGAESAYAGMFNDTAPTSSVFTLGADGQVNTNGGTYIAYCFAEVKGFSKMGSYTGNGNADAPFIYTGFKPNFIMLKNTSTAQDWQMYTWDMQPYNEFCTTSAGRLKANTADTQSTKTAFDMLSNGFKMRTDAADINGSGNQIIYMAFAEAPLVGTNNVPANAR